MPWIELKRTIEGNQVRRFVPDELRDFKHMFCHVDFLDNARFWLIVAQMVNVPYEDLPLRDRMCGYTDTDSGIQIWRPNHDVAHGIRKLLYLVQLFNLLQQTGDHRAQQFIGSLSVAQNNLLYLLVFLERSGRTNELGSSHDDTIMKRSAEIFDAVALEQLMCPKSLVGHFSDILLGRHRSHDRHRFLSSDEQFVQDRARFLHNCVIAVHHIDLLRCRKTTDVRGWLFEDIKGLIPLADVESSISICNTMISFAEIALHNTGTRYNPMTGAIHPDESSQKVACIKNPGFIIDRLRALLFPSPLKLLTTQAQVSSPPPEPCRENDECFRY